MADSLNNNGAVSVSESQAGVAKIENKRGQKMHLNEIKTRQRRPKVEEPADYALIGKLNDAVNSLDSYFRDQNNAYQKLKTLREETSDENLVMVSGIVETAEIVEDDLNWSTTTLTDLFSRKKELVEQNKGTYLAYKFKEFTQPVLTD